MKKILSISFVALACAVLFSCSKDDSNPYDIPVYYYLAVNDTGRIAIYKDDAQIFSYSDEISHVNDMTMADGKFELCGHVIEKLQNRPALWIDGKLVKPLADSIGTVSAIYRDGNDRYCLATIVGKNDFFGVLMKNGSIVYASEEGVSFDKFGVGASGDFYIAGRVKDENTNIFNKAYLWRIRPSDFVLVVPPMEMMSSDKEIIINDLRVGVYNIAAAIEKVESPQTTSAWGWLYDNRVGHPGQCTQLAGSNSKSSSTVFANGYWFVGGARPNGTSFDATIWRNGYGVIPMELECNPGGSYVPLMYFGGYNTYQCVHSPGQIQLCRNGALRIKINCSTTVIPAAWLVVRQ